jgi:arginine decarboxylase-like protein
MAKYNVEVWDITFYKVNDDGEALLNKDGSVKLFQDTNSKLDFSWIRDAIDSTNEDMLEEISDG